jgi:hypothetical protein
MMTAGSTRTPQVSCGQFVPPRFGRPSTPPAPYPWLVFAFLNEWGPPAAAITWIAVTWIAVTWIAVTWIAVTWQRIQNAGGVVRTTLRISGTLAGKAAAEAEKVLINARRALHHQQGTDGTAPGSNPRRSPDPDRTPDPGPQAGQYRRPDLQKRESKINTSAGPADRRPRTPQQPPADFFRSK